MTRESVPEWIFPPEGGFTADDLDRLPDLPPHTELIDGSLVIVSPQRNFHGLAVDLLMAGLRITAPDSVRVRREMTVTLGRRQRPEPDLIVVKASAAAADPNVTTYQPADVLLAVEVVSPESDERDRSRKPELYAEAGIPHFWLVEQEDGRPVVYVYTLDPVTRKYIPEGVHRDRLKVPVPFEIDIDLAAIDRL